MSIKKIVGKRIVAKRTELGITQEELASKVGISINSLSAIENGKVYSKLNNIYNVCKALGLKMADLFDGY